MSKIPIFIITHDRYSVLNYSIDSYLKTIKSPFEIVLLDQKSIFQPTIDYLRVLESNGISVIWNYRNGNMDEMLYDIKIAIYEWLQKNPSPYYIVTDPDIALDGCKGDILFFYADLLEKLPEAVCVGPMLRIDDIPDYYPFKNNVVEQHYSGFWQQLPIALPWDGCNYHLQPSHFDTTFAMYRSDFPFLNHNAGLRSYAPYMAKHLDWYIDPAAMTDDQVFYLEHGRQDIANWSCRMFHEAIDKPV